MISLRSAARVVTGLTAVALFVTGVYLFFPASRIDEALDAVLSPQGLSLTPHAHKTLLPGVAWDGVKLSSDKGMLLKFDRLSVRPQFLPLLAGKVRVSADARVGNGALALTYGVNGREAVELDASGLNLADIPFFATILGAHAAGEIWSRGVLQRGQQGVGGELKLEIKRLEFSGVKLGAFPLPDVSGLTTQGMIRVTNGAARLESLTLQGEGIYMRLSGDLPSGEAAAVTPLNMTLEIMPKPDFLERQKLVFMLLAKFMVSPGVYRTPIKGTLLKPEIL